jgi:trimeric autotransporter adhesin
LTSLDDESGSGPAIYAGGRFTAAGGATANRVAKWDGSNWSPLGSGMNDTVLTLTAFDDGTGPALYAGGSFTTAGGSAANRVAKWNGTSWSNLGSGMNKDVHTLTGFSSLITGGPALYAGGKFTTADGTSANHIAVWNGTGWFPLGLGGGMNDDVRALLVFDDGSGPALFAGGAFTTAGGIPAQRMAKWNGLWWSPLDLGMDDEVFALASFDDSSASGPLLYAGGAFTTAGGASADGVPGPVPGPHIASWNGLNWASVGSGVNHAVYALSTFNDISKGRVTPMLCAGGEFTIAGGEPANRIATWNGTSWSPLGNGMELGVHALVPWTGASDDAQGIIAGGVFRTSFSGDSNLALWHSCPESEPADLNDD